MREKNESLPKKRVFFFETSIFRWERVDSCEGLFRVMWRGLYGIKWCELKIMYGKRGILLVSCVDEFVVIYKNLSIRLSVSLMQCM